MSPILQIVDDWMMLTTGSHHTTYDKDKEGVVEDRGMYADYNAWAVTEGSLGVLVDHPSYPLAEDDHGNTLLHYAGTSSQINNY